jgi:hypothetical protein
MLRRTLLVIVFACLLGTVWAQEKKGGNEPTLMTATGTVDKADKDAVTIKPRGADGKFQKSITLKVTGTSKVAVLTPQKRADGVVLTQRESAAKDLVPGQVVAVIYADAGKDGPVLLSAVTQPAPEK